VSTVPVPTNATAPPAEASVLALVET